MAHHCCADFGLRSGWNDSRPAVRSSGRIFRPNREPWTHFELYLMIVTLTGTLIGAWSLLASSRHAPAEALTWLI